MKRRVFIASSVAGVTALSGCMGIFSDDDEEENPEETQEPNEDVEPPHEGLNMDGIAETFIEQHFQTLGSVSYTVTYSTQTEAGNPKETKWRRGDSSAYSSTTVNSELVEEEYYSGDYVGINAPDRNSVNILERNTPPVREWANASFLLNLVNNGTFSIDSETESSVVYAGVLTSEESSYAAQLHISKERPIVTMAEISDLNQSYELTDIGSTSVKTPDWFTEARENNVIVTGGVYEDGEALIVQTNDNSQPIPQGSLISVIPPGGSSLSISLEEEVSPGKSVYIIFRGGEPYYSVGQLPSLSNRDQLTDGPYIIRGISPDGDQQYEIQLIADSSSE